MVKVEITSGDTGTRYYELQNTASFIGSDQECDMVLADDCFPPIYAFLLLHPHGVVLRHLGRGPEISVDGQSTRRLLITNQAHIVAGPFSFLLRVSPNASGHAEAVTVEETGKPSSEDGPVKLIEQASRLLSQIQEQAGHKNSLSQRYRDSQKTDPPRTSSLFPQFRSIFHSACLQREVQLLNGITFAFSPQ